MSRYLLLGGTGTLGQAAVSQLRTSGHVVDAPGRSEFDLSAGSSKPFVEPGTEAVIYLAQSRRFREFPAGAQDMFQVNVSAPLTLLEQAATAGARTFVYASTGGVYRPSAKPLTEASALAEPMGFYPASKRAFERLSEAFRDKIAVVLLRFFFIYGPGQPQHMLIPRLAARVREGKPIQLPLGDGLRINPVHVDDAAQAVAAAAFLARSDTINVAGPDVSSLGEIARRLGELHGRDPLFEQSGSGDALPLVADIGRMQQVLGAPSIRLAQGLGSVL